MLYIYMDESGDLGFNPQKKKSSKFFVITFVFVRNPNTLERIVKKIFKTFKKERIKKHTNVLHAYKETKKTIETVLRVVEQRDISIMCVVLNKKKVYTRLQDQKHVLYNYVVNILLDRIYSKKLMPKEETVMLVAAKRETNKFLNQNFKNYLENQLLENHNIKIAVEIKTTYENKGLQIADIICWSIFRKHEHKDNTYYAMIKDRIVEERNLF